MDSNKVDAFIISNSNRLPESQISLIRETLLSTDESKTFSIQAMQFKDPTIALIISLIGGSLGGRQILYRQYRIRHCQTNHLWWLWLMDFNRSVPYYGCYTRC